MTKTKKNLTWKLEKLPTASELADLVDAEVISKDEAREIMFGSAENDKEKIKALEEQIDFLRELVTELSKNKSHTIVHDWTYSRPLRYYNSGVHWGDTVRTLAKSGYAVGESVMSTNIDNNSGELVSLSVNTVQGSSGTSLVS